MTLINTNANTFEVTKPECETCDIINEMIEFISFTPTRNEREALYKQSIAAQKQSEEYIGVDSPKDLITKNQNSKDIGFKTTVFTTKQESAFYSDADFCIFNTQKFPLIGGSIGSNCTPVVPNSINLFDTDEKTTRINLGRFMIWRKNNELNIFKAYVHSLEQFEKSEKKEFFEQSLISRGLEHLEININDYHNIVQIFRNKLSNLDESSDLNSQGIRFNSFCQTWMKKGQVGKANFSVPSPHFQTFPYLDISICTDLQPELVEKYNRLLKVQNHDMMTKIVDGQLEYEKSFVNLDNMWKKMNEKNIFFINSVPNFDTLSLIMEVRDSLIDGDFVIVLSSCLTTYMNAVNILDEYKDASYIDLLPSNFRAPIKPGTKINGVDCTLENYLRIQENISSVLATIFSWCQREMIDVFFASAPREYRPLYIKSASADVKPNNFVNYDSDLTDKVVKELLIPALSYRMGTESSTNVVEKALDTFMPKYKASFLADVTTIGVGSEMLDDPTAWFSYELLEEPDVKYWGKICDGPDKMNCDEPNGKYEGMICDEPDLIYLSAKFTRGPGTFKSLSHTGQTQVGQALRKAISRNQPVWKSCFIMHDEFLNDIDDVAANYLARCLTEKGGFYLFKNYE